MPKKKTIEIIARGVCIKRGMLLLCHGKGKGNTYLPGGHVEFKESAPDSLVREVREELGVKSSAKRFLGCVEHTFKYEGKRTCEVNLVFELDVPSVSPSKSPPSAEDYIEFIWWPVNKLYNSSLEPFVLREMIPAWHERRANAAAWASTCD
ncbi:MAG: hypothetical protein C0404_11470 [Verrucomicrobia bacterium]|nr:hypothetical protein [Verrucomicrobiota bacterium]